MKKKNRSPASAYVIFSTRLPWHVRMRDLLLTVLIWAMYFYFMKDFGIFARDAAIWISHGYDDPSQYPGLKILPDVAGFFEITAVLVSILVGWSYYNLIRYGKRNRRQASPPVTIEQTSADYGVVPHDLKLWQKTQIMTMHLDVHGRVSRVEPN